MSLYDFRVHQGPLLQRGRGIGSLFRGVSRYLVPFFSSTAKKLVQSPAARSIARDLKKQTIASGVGLARDVLAGKSVKAGIKSAGKQIQARAAKTVGKQLDRATAGKKKRPSSAGKSPLPKRAKLSKKLLISSNPRKQTLFV